MTTATLTTAPVAARTGGAIVLQTIPLATPPLALDIALARCSSRQRKHFNGDPNLFRQFAECPAAERASFSLISGLVNFGIDTLLPEPATYVTLLRDPVECAIALYYLVLSSPAHYMHKFLTPGDPKVEDFVNQRRGEIDNPNVRALNPRTDRPLPFGQVTRAMLEHAKQVLADRYVFGLAERFDESMVLLQHTLGWDQVSYPGKQALPPRPLQEGVAPETVARLREINHLDAELYVFAQDLFSRRIDELRPAFDQGLADLRERNTKQAAETVWIRGQAVTVPADDTISPEIVWLASYPRSGNTWLRFLLDSYGFPPAQLMHDIGRLSLELDWWMGEAARLNQPESWIAAAARLVRDRNPRPPGFPRDLLFKTHFALTDKHPLRNRTRAAVLLIRDPKDVLLSGMNFSELTTDAPLASERGYALDYISRGGDPGWINTGYGTWESHTESWLDNPGFPVLCVRYEELKADTPGQLQKILEFLGAPIDPVRIRQAVDNCSLVRLRNLEVASRAMTALPKLKKQDKFFFHKGLSGQTLAHLGDDVATAYRERFASAAARHGYSV